MPDTQGLSLYHLTRPASPSADKPPLLILLHGVGSHEQDLFGLTPYLDERFFVISARGPITLMPDSYAWYHVDLPRMIINAEEEAATRLLILKFIDEAIAAYDVDPSRVYLTGFSQGAIMSYSVLFTAPRKIAGVVAMSGRLLDEVRPANGAFDGIDNFPLFVAHGQHDPVIPIRFAREARDYLQTLPVDLTYREYPMAHQISPDSLSDVVAWLERRLT